MTIPNSRLDRFGIDSLYQERIKPEFVEKAQIGDYDVAILYEKPRPGFTYGCAPKDVLLIRDTPSEEVYVLNMFRMRGSRL